MSGVPNLDINLSRMIVLVSLFSANISAHSERASGSREARVICLFASEFGHFIYLEKLNVLGFILGGDFSKQNMVARPMEELRRHIMLE